MPEPQPVPFFDLRRQYAALESGVLERLRAFLPTQALTGGPVVEAFEANAAAYLGVPHAVAVSNGTDALLVSLMALGVGPGDEVIVPAFTFFCTASVVARLGARPVFADILPDSFNIDPAAFGAAVTPRTRAVIPVHLFGQACDLDRILPTAERHNIPVVEDTAQAFGAAWRGRKLGGFGRFGTFSFYPTKNIGAFGEGGMIACAGDADARALRALRVHGSEERYRHSTLGGNFRLASIQALVLDLKLPHLDAWIARRRAHAARYLESLRGVGDLVLPSETPGAVHTWNQFTLRTARRDALRAHLAARQVGADIYYPLPVPLQEAFASLGHKPGDFPESVRAAREVLSLPIFPELREEELDRVIDGIRAFF